VKSITSDVEAALLKPIIRSIL